MRTMKDSGIEWIGEIPESWSVERNKQLFCEINDRCENGNEHTLLSVSEYYGIAPKSDKISDGEFETRAESLDGYKLCEIGDIVMNIMLAWKRSTGRTEYNGIVSPAYCVYRPIGNIDTKYYHYLFRTDIVANLFKQYSTGIIDSRLRLYPDKFLALRMIVPPLHEQQAISSFLDRQCAHIDNIIEKTKASIEEYKKLRQAVITQAVTKGVRGDRPMKDTGFDWLLQIPADWTMERGKNLFFETNIRSNSGEEELLTVSQYTGVTPRSQKNVNMFEAESLEGYKICEIGDIAANTMWLWAGAIGVSEYYGVISPSYNIYRQKNAAYNSKYLDYLLRIPPIVQLFASLSTGIRASRLRLYPEQFLNIYYPLPPLDEQAEIVAYLQEKIVEVDKLITKKEQFLTELESYKKSMIYEYVTGKKTS